ncbi:hypothetical protein EYC84_007922 [Monilinia fructicola]|uniref:Uncharacterized protein n=1 Tax=Monilinia fructicola TaxID=38448 RepID=A0A5M9JMF6_MONFR|nr:hypothetical protein EYC84_007922 [Monilinia fructicola]
MTTATQSRFLMSNHINIISIFHGVYNIIGGFKYDTSAASKSKINILLVFISKLFILPLFIISSIKDSSRFSS